MARMDPREVLSGGWEARSIELFDVEPDIDETEFEDLATFRLKPEAIEGESPVFLARYAEYLRRQGLNFD